MRLTTGDFKECFGGMTREARCEIAKHDFTYMVISKDIPILKNPVLREPVGNKKVWEIGWEENLNNFRTTHNANDLIPKYYHPGRALRYKDDLIMPNDADFELNFLKVFRKYIFSFFKSYNPIYEFGCGTGFNLVTLNQMYPDKELHGLDWAGSSVKLLNEINQVCKLNIKPHLFDMFNPSNLAIPDGGAVFTWGVLEQLGEKWEPFLQFLLQKKVFVINIEPIAELFNPDNEMDKHSIEYMGKRGYLKGWLTRLLKLEAERRIKIERIQRQHFGNMNYEGWSFIIWRVKCNTRELVTSQSLQLGKELRALKTLT